jgi:hypothetical protein
MSLQHSVCGLGGLSLVLGDDDAFAGGQTIRFEDNRKAEPGDGFGDVFGRLDDHEPRGRNRVLLKKLLGEDFAAFELSCAAGGAQHRAATLVEFVYQPGNQGRFGSDYGQGGV